MERRVSLRTDSLKCTQCLSCQLICSITHAGRFNPGTARVRISGNEPKINFEAECTRCGLCARHCLYGAIVQMEEEV